MTLVRVGERGVDFSFARPPADRLLELGFTFIVGYISVPPASPNKNLTRAEIETYREAGLAVGLVWEMDAARPNKGATYGELDGASARREAVKRDWPMDLPIITACDLNSFADNIDRHEMYVRGFHKTVEQEWIGIYGDTDILARTVGIWNIGWVPVGAWAWSGTSKADAIARAKAVGAHVLQSKGYYIDNIWAVDPNDVINEFPAWGTAVFPPPIPEPVPPNPLPQPEDDMPSVILTVNDSPDQYLWTPGSDPVLFASEGDRDQIYAALKITTGVVVTREQFDRLFVSPVSVVIPPVEVPPLTGHISADVDTGTWHITGSIG